MITADRKPFDEIYAMTEGHDRVLVAGCDTCVAICMSGGEREAEISPRRSASRPNRRAESHRRAHGRDPPVRVEYLDAIGEQVGGFRRWSAA